MSKPILSAKHKKQLLDIIRNTSAHQKVHKDLQEIHTTIKTVHETSKISHDENIVKEVLIEYVWDTPEGKVFNPDKKKRKSVIIKSKSSPKKSDTVTTITTTTNTVIDINNFTSETQDNLVSYEQLDKTVSVTTSVQEELEPTSEDLEKEFNSLCVSHSNNNSNNSTYVSTDVKYKGKMQTSEKFGPYSKSFINDIQYNDIYTEEHHAQADKVLKLLSIEYPPQRSDEWFLMRDGKMTASDVGVVTCVNKYEPQYTFIVKKVFGKQFNGNANTHRGKKYEKIATLVYEYRMNVHVEEFGLIGHPVHTFLGASPDGIVGLYKNDEKHKTNLVGRMVEIKCPKQITTEGEIIGDICKPYYWAQVQLQLECCDLDKCDFWQCDMYEYKNKQEFLNDTDAVEPFRSKFNGFEKGCVIQLIPRDKMADTITDYFQAVIDHAEYIYPPKIEMSPYECDQWILSTIDELQTQCVKKGDKYYNLVFDKILYWRLNNTHCVTLDRDKEWFKTELPRLKQMWDYVEFFRKYPDKKKILEDYIDSLNIKKNDKIMDVVKKLYEQNPNTTEQLTNTILNNNVYKKVKKNKDVKYIAPDEDVID